jgi:uncharacterized protein (DUF1800 family)
MQGLAGLAALGAAGCTSAIDRRTQPDVSKGFTLPTGTSLSPAAHLLNRAAFGPRPGQVKQIETLGAEAWIAQQLAYETLDDSACDLRLRRYDTLNLKAIDLRSFGWDENYIAGELTAATVTRAVYSERQLFERMVEFWTDHFNIYAFKDNVIFLKSVDDREVIRRHALGSFGDLLRASAHSPAMLRYLDNTLNMRGQPNENYAREIMELHTLGVNGGYTEQDVKAVARCLTGWTMDGQNEFQFRADWHDTGEKIVLGHTIPAGGGQDDAEHVLDILIDHPATARFVSTKLVRHFVADEPPSGSIDACVATWRDTHGDLRAVMRTLLTHPGFASAPPKFKRPFDLAVSFMRAADVNYNGDPKIMNVLEKLGQRPFAWPRPDGYPDIALRWGGNLVDRWNFGIDALAARLPGVQFDLWALAKLGGADGDLTSLLGFFARLFFATDLPPSDTTALINFIHESLGDTPDLNRPETRLHVLAGIAVMLVGPSFQWR